MDDLSNVSNIVSDGRTPRPNGTQGATGEGQRLSTSSQEFYDATGRNPSGRLVADVSTDERRSLSCTNIHRIATWNVQGMNLGKLDIVKQEMDRLQVDILGISELHWTGNGYFHSDEYTVFYSGHDNVRRSGVAFIANKKTARVVESSREISDRIMTIRLRGKPLNITIVQVYAPTTDTDDDVIESFYADVQKVIDGLPKKDILYILGDFNAKIGNQPEVNIAGSHGLGERNEAGDRLIQFCQENRLRITNTWFMQPKRRLYTWTSPNGIHRNQIDYILCSHRWRSSVVAVKTYPGADCGSDHELLVAKIRIKFCNTKICTPPKRFDVSKVPLSYTIEVRNRFELLDISEKQPEELWGEIRSMITETARQHVTWKKPEKRRNWLSEETLRIADQRRAAKIAGNKDEVRRLNADFQRAARKDKEKDWNERCKQLEKDFKNGHTRNFFAQVKRARTPFIAQKGTIKDKNGVELSDQQSIRDRWREYTKDLYSCNVEPGTSPAKEPLELEPPVMEAEVARAVKQLAKNKAPGIDCIPAELLYSVPLKIITTLCQSIWESCTWPQDWKRSVFIPLPKKGDARDCCNYRTIALIPHASKILLKIIQERLRPTIEAELPKEQAGFRRGRGTRDHIANLRWIMEKTREYQKKIYMCFIDYSKAFDCVEHDKLWKALQELGVSAHLIRLIRSLYEGQEATVRTTYGDTDWFEISKGVRQGCILSPFLFNLYAELIMRRAELGESEVGVKIGGKNINNLRYADDTTLLAESKKGLEELITKIKTESEKMGLYLNIKKTKIMATTSSGKIKIKIDDEEIECVQDFVFLGSKIDLNGESSCEIKRRIALGRTALISMGNIWKNKDIGIATKRRLIQAIVFPITMYGCESWTVKKADRRRIDAFELWCWRKLLRIPWTARVTNKEVLERIRPEISLEGKMTRLRLTYFGHVMRSESLEKAMMLGMVNGKRRPGRQRARWLDTIKADTGTNISQLKEQVQDRQTWREIAYRVAEGRIRLNS